MSAVQDFGSLRFDAGDEAAAKQILVKSLQKLARGVTRSARARLHAAFAQEWQLLREAGVENLTTMGDTAALREEGLRLLADLLDSALTAEPAATISVAAAGGHKSMSWQVAHGAFGEPAGVAVFAAAKVTTQGRNE